ncbi:YciI family protein [Pararhizobium mangrovi]|uniref:YCII-related domain-containing protein n=1 Tax=Pararhizobium mangrovi TaxID=2590452 RepID=A0A506U0A2_9HYPH|nr:YciI family protein [Pararhizobium mangrovi]TPW27752.1 hypothetical protein FJU11_10985 [Pararhizobium mangrovi]
MLFALLCTDKPDSVDLRQENRPKHLEHLDRMNKAGQLKMAGPFTDADGSPTGSLVIIEASDADEARAIADTDPYAEAGLFSSVEVKPFRWTVNNPDG